VSLSCGLVFSVGEVLLVLAYLMLTASFHIEVTSVEYEQLSFLSSIFSLNYYELHTCSIHELLT